MTYLAIYYLNGRLRLSLNIILFKYGDDDMTWGIVNRIKKIGVSSISRLKSDQKCNDDTFPYNPLDNSCNLFKFSCTSLALPAWRSRLATWFHFLNLFTGRSHAACFPAHCAPRFNTNALGVWQLHWPWNVW